MAEAKSRGRRVAILVDTETHMMPDLAREMARRDHNLVIGNVADGLVEELEGLGAEVEAIDGRLDLAQSTSYKQLIEAAEGRFGGYDSVCIRTGAHGTGTILEATQEDCQYLYEGNFLQAFLALSDLLPPLVAQGSGQIVINTSASGQRPASSGTLYSALRAGANMLVRNAALTVGQYGVTVNATGTYAMNYPSFLHDMGADKDPAIKKQIEGQCIAEALAQAGGSVTRAAGLLGMKRPRLSQLIKEHELGPHRPGPKDR